MSIEYWLSYQATRDRIQEARPIYHLIGHKLGEANCIRDLGLLARGQENWTEAEVYFQQSFEIYRSINSAYDIAWSHFLLGQVATAQNEAMVAHEHYQTAHKLFQAIGLQGEAAMIEQAMAGE